MHRRSGALDSRVELAAAWIQSLQLVDGALYAVGPAGSDRTERSYAVLGGTGRFTGARGTCVVREMPGSGARRSLLFEISLA